MSSNTLEDIFAQAERTQGSVNLHGLGYKAYIYLGVKITKDKASGEIKIYDPSKSVNYYIEIEQELYKVFLKKGWKKSVIDLTLKKYKDKLDRVQSSIAKEMNGNKSPKRLRILKETREQILKKYFKLTQKLKLNEKLI